MLVYSEVTGKKHNKALNSACSIFLLSEPKIVTKIAYFIQIFAAQPNGQTKYFVIRFLQNKVLGIFFFTNFVPASTYRLYDEGSYN